MPLWQKERAVLYPFIKKIWTWGQYQNGNKIWKPKQLLWKIKLGPAPHGGFKNIWFWYRASFAFRNGCCSLSLEVSRPSITLEAFGGHPISWCSRRVTDHRQRAPCPASYPSCPPFRQRPRLNHPSPHIHALRQRPCIWKKPWEKYSLPQSRGRRSRRSSLTIPTWGTWTLCPLWCSIWVEQLVEAGWDRGGAMHFEVCRLGCEFKDAHERLWIVKT